LVLVETTPYCKDAPRQTIEDYEHLCVLLGGLSVKAAYPLEKKFLNKAERAVLFAYLEKFGELPPLNANLRAVTMPTLTSKILEWARKGII